MANHIKNFLGKFTTLPANWKVKLIQKWPTIIGNLADKVSLEHVDNTFLVLGVNNSSWLQELYLMAPMLCNMINQHLDEPHIKEIRFKTVTHSKKTMPHTKRWQRSTKPVTLKKHEHETLNTIADPELREALKQFLIRCYQEKE